jgi:hypothetical protein
MNFFLGSARLALLPSVHPLVERAGLQSTGRAEFFSKKLA